jgi:peptidoglycan/LPS O-acetylase OafA/YrhL
LHTWSLAVEWQFYLLLPLLLATAWKWRPDRRYMTAMIGSGLLLSLLFCVVATRLWPTASFYLLPTRVWEMLAGGLTCLLAHRCVLTKRAGTTLEAVGMLIVAGAVLGFDASSPWPGWCPIAPLVAQCAYCWQRDPVRFGLVVQSRNG